MITHNVQITHTSTRPTQKQNKSKLKLLRIYKQKTFHLDLKCLAEVAKTSTGIEFQAHIVLTKKIAEKHLWRS